jgi:hypothetical protein
LLLPLLLPAAPLLLLTARALASCRRCSRGLWARPAAGDCGRAAALLLLATAPTRYCPAPLPLPQHPLMVATTALRMPPPLLLARRR